MKFIVPENLPLLDALSLGAPDCTKSTLRSWLKQGRVLVDGETAKHGNVPLHKGQVLTLAPKERVLEGLLPVIYEDPHFVVVDKPAGLLSVSTPFESQRTAHAILKRHYRPKRVYVVHRIDQETSGVMLFALSWEGLEQLKKTFMDHLIERKYAALVEGHPDEEKGTWRSYLVEDNNYYVHETQDTKKGELAVSHYIVIGKSKKGCWLDVTLETGKKNQIRVHCKNAGIPVVGDKKYGAKTDPIHRLCLHAYHLVFPHPSTGKIMRFESKVPKSFARVVKPLGEPYA